MWIEINFHVSLTSLSLAPFLSLFLFLFHLLLSSCLPPSLSLSGPYVPQPKLIFTSDDSDNIVIIKQFSPGLPSSKTCTMAHFRHRQRSLSPASSSTFTLKHRLPPEKFLPHYNSLSLQLLIFLLFRFFPFPSSVPSPFSLLPLQSSRITPHSLTSKIRSSRSLKYPED